MRKNNFKPMMLLFFVLMLISCAEKRRLAAKMYPYNHERFEYPENKFLVDKKNVGVAFSGGGSRASSLAIGQLRGLHKLGMLKHIKYISAVSGGGWASVCYTYSQLGEDELLGPYKKPSELTMNYLNTANGKLIGCISNGKLIWRFIGAAFTFHGDEIFARLLNRVYLKPLGLEENRFAGYSAAVTKEICERSTNTDKLSPEKFYHVNPGERPYLILSGTVVGNLRNTNHLPAMHMEMTPIYSGVTYYNFAQKKFLGGGYTENIAVDHRFRGMQNDSISFVKRNRLPCSRHVFTISDMMAITGAAPATIIYKLRIGLFGFPEIRMWSPYRAATMPRHKVKSREYPIGDGGNLENLGLIPLLKRRVDKIIVFVNSLRPIKLDKNGNIELDRAIPHVFGVKRGGHFSIATNLLNNDEHQFEKLADTLYKLKKAGCAVIHTDNYKVNSNSDYGILTDDSWNTVEITWVYNDNFEPVYTKPPSDLNDEVRSFYYFKGFDSYKHHFPHLPTFFTSRRGRGIEYDVAWSNMLAHFSSWVVVDHEPLFKKVLGLP